MEKQITTKNQMKKLKVRLNSRIKNSFNGLKSRLDAEERMIYESLFYVHYLCSRQLEQTFCKLKHTQIYKE